MTRSRRRTTVRRAAGARTSGRQMARQQEVIRVLLERRGAPLALDALASRLGVSERTLDRDLERIRAAELPLRGRGGAGGGVWLDVSRQPAPLALDHEQVMGLLLVIDALDVELPAGLQRTKDELRRRLDDPQLF